MWPTGSPSKWDSRNISEYKEHLGCKCKAFGGGRVHGHVYERPRTLGLQLELVSTLKTFQKL